MKDYSQPPPPPALPPPSSRVTPSSLCSPCPQYCAVPWTGCQTNPVQETDEQSDAQGGAASHPPIEHAGLSFSLEDDLSDDKEARLSVQETNPAPQADEGSQLPEAAAPAELDGLFGQTSEAEDK